MIFQILVPFFVSAIVSLSVNLIYWNKKHKMLSIQYLTIREEMKPYLKEDDILLENIDTAILDLFSGRIRLSEISFETRINNRGLYFEACRHDFKISKNLYDEDIKILKKDLKKAKGVSCKIDKSLLEWVKNKDAIR